MYNDNRAVQAKPFSLGQFDLLKATKRQRRTSLGVHRQAVPHGKVLRPAHRRRGLAHQQVHDSLRPVSADKEVEEMICSTLAKNRDGLVGGQESLKGEEEDRPERRRGPLKVQQGSDTHRENHGVLYWCGTSRPARRRKTTAAAPACTRALDDRTNAWRASAAQQ